MCNDCVDCHKINGKYYSFVGTKVLRHVEGFNLSDKVPLTQAQISTLEPQLTQATEVNCLEALAVLSSDGNTTYVFADKILNGQIIGIDFTEIVDGVPSVLYSYIEPVLNITNITDGFSLGAGNRNITYDITLEQSVSPSGNPIIYLKVDGTTVSQLPITITELSLEDAAFDVTTEILSLPIKDENGAIIRTETINFSSFLKEGQVTSDDETVEIALIADSAGGNKVDLSSKIQTVKKLKCSEDGGSFYVYQYTYLRNLNLPYPENLKPITGTEAWQLIEEDGIEVALTNPAETTSPIATLIPCNDCCTQGLSDNVQEYHTYDLQLTMEVIGGLDIIPNDDRDIIFTLKNVGFTDIINQNINILFPVLATGASNSIPFQLAQTGIGIADNSNNITYSQTSQWLPVTDANYPDDELKSRTLSIAVGNELKFGMNIIFTTGIIERNLFAMNIHDFGADSNPNNNKNYVIFNGYTV